VLFLTAWDTPSELEHLRCLGANGIIQKPFDPLQLPSQVRAALEQAPDS
jgi:DNA-binding response OmpR family regulator